MLLIVLVVLLPVLRAVVVPPPHIHDHDHPHPLPDLWYQHPDHPVHSLFRRAPDDGTPYPAVGTPEWGAGFPVSNVLDLNATPLPWLQALNASIAAGKIPDIPRSSNTPNTSPVYPDGVVPTGPQICSATYHCRIPGDIWDAPPGILGSSFDDGPLPPTPQLVEFLQNNNVSTTHFMIGINIRYYPTQFLSAFNAGHDIGVHTWSHPYMTTLSNLAILAELGWTIQLIHNSTGGRVPRYWRPPYGDSDMRVRSIAKEVFGLETIIWNSDSSDWSASDPQQVVNTITRYLTGPKTPGLVLLEHTNSAITIGGFMAVYPLVAANGWSYQSVTQVVGAGRTYQNANSSTSPVSVKGVLLNDVQTSSSSVSSSSSSLPPPTPTSTTSIRRASPTPSTRGKKNSAILRHPSISFALFSTAILCVILS